VINTKEISAAASSSSLETFFKPEKVGNNEEQLGTTEGAFAYHTVIVLGLCIVHQMYSK
jgi:hypothetical protein